MGTRGKRREEGGGKTRGSKKMRSEKMKSKLYFERGEKKNLRIWGITEKDPIEIKFKS